MVTGPKYQFGLPPVRGNAAVAWETTTVRLPNGVDLAIRYERGDDLKNRQVALGTTRLTLTPGTPIEFLYQNIQIRWDGADLWAGLSEADQKKVEFRQDPSPSVSSPSVSAQVDRSLSQARQVLADRFPGVVFEGVDPSEIGPLVTIEAGAQISGPVAIRGTCSIGPSAVISGGASGAEIDSSTVNGTVQGGRVERSTIEKDARVSAADIRDSLVGSFSSVSAATVDHTTIGAEVFVKASTLSHMTVADECMIRTATLSGFALARGESVKGSVHQGGLNPAASLSHGVFPATVNHVLKNVAAGISHIGSVVAVGGEFTDLHVRGDLIAGAVVRGSVVAGGGNSTTEVYVEGDLVSGNVITVTGGRHGITVIGDGASVISDDNGVITIGGQRRG